MSFAYFLLHAKRTVAARWQWQVDVAGKVWLCNELTMELPWKGGSKCQVGLYCYALDFMESLVALYWWSAPSHFLEFTVHGLPTLLAVGSAPGGAVVRLLVIRMNEHYIRINLLRGPESFFFLISSFCGFQVHCITFVRMSFNDIFIFHMTIFV